MAVRQTVVTILGNQRFSDEALPERTTSDTSLEDFITEYMEEFKDKDISSLVITIINPPPNKPG